LFYRGLWETDYGRHWKRSISLYRSSARETWREESFTGDPEGYVNEDSGNEYLSLQMPRWETWWEGFFLPGTLRDQRRAFCKQRIISVWQLCAEILEGGLFTGNSESYIHIKEGFGNGAFLFLWNP
jgi:hypothetical protein